MDGAAQVRAIGSVPYRTSVVFEGVLSSLGKLKFGKGKSFLSRWMDYVGLDEPEEQKGEEGKRNNERKSTCARVVVAHITKHIFCSFF